VDATDTRRKSDGDASSVRPARELVEKYGFDTKFAMHALRLGIQGCEFLATGRLTLPMQEQDRDYLLGVRQGVVSFDAVLERLRGLEEDLTALRRTSSLPDEPDNAAADDFLNEEYLKAWGWSLKSPKS
jgi:hypothetical protein